MNARAVIASSAPDETSGFREFPQSSLITRHGGRTFSGTELLGCERTSFGRGGYGRSSGGSGGFRSFKPKPVEVGKEYDVTISEISRRGDGIAKIDGFVIFVAGAKQGWQGKIKVTQVANRFATGAVVGGSEGMTGTEGQASTSESTESGM
jgi:predicted RNA-binding protein with TRAM domain